MASNSFAGGDMQCICCRDDIPTMFLEISEASSFRVRLPTRGGKAFFATGLPAKYFCFECFAELFCGVVLTEVTPHHVPLRSFPVEAAEIQYNGGAWFRGEW